MTDDYMSPADRFAAAIGHTGPSSGRAADASTQTAEAPPAGGEGAVTPWGTLHTSPREQLAALNANPDFRAALLDRDHPGHALAVKQRSQLYAAVYGDEPVPPAGSGWGGMSPVVHEGFTPPTEEEMARAYADTAAAALEKHGVESETAQSIAALAIGAGLSTLDVSDVAQAIANSREYTSPEQARAELDDDTIRRAQATANALRLPPELVNLDLGTGIVLGEHPQFVRWLARRKVD